VSDRTLCLSRVVHVQGAFLAGLYVRLLRLLRACMIGILGAAALPGSASTLRQLR
jgi:hypothetical protein